MTRQVVYGFEALLVFANLSMEFCLVETLKAALFSPLELNEARVGQVCQWSGCLHEVGEAGSLQVLSLQLRHLSFQQLECERNFLLPQQLLCLLLLLLLFFLPQHS